MKFRNALDLHRALNALEDLPAADRESAKRAIENCLSEITLDFENLSEIESWYNQKQGL